MPISQTEEPRIPAGVVGPIPKKLGRFEVIDRLATGGMAEVFVCSERGIGGLERLAVVKRILPQLAVHSVFVEMFLAEARYVARLNHPNVVQVFELGQDEHGAPFLAMEYVAGNSVRELIIAAIERDQRVPIGAAVGIIVQACAGAHAAHELVDPSGRPLGLVHRDLSPHNLMVTADGHVKLLDFGIAKATEAAFPDDHTRTGGLKGKVHYMSPEQCKQHALDRRSDVFALAVVLWETLAEERLFKRSSELESMQAIIGGERKDLRKIRSDAPEELVRLIERALAPAREDRAATADELRRGLLDVCSARGIDCGSDQVAAFVRPLLGDAQRARQSALLQRARDGEEATISGSHGSHGSQTRSVEARPRAEPIIAALPSRKRSPVFALVVLGLILGVAVGVIDRVFHRGGPPLVIGFPPTADAHLMLEDTEALRAWLEDQLDRPATIAIAKSYDDLQARVLSGELELAAMPPYLFLETQQKDPRVEIVATKLVEGSSGNDSILYIGESSSIGSIAELKGKRICFADKKSTTGYLFPRLALRRAGLDPDQDVEGHLSGSHMQALRDLIAGTCDAAATYSGAFLAADRAGIAVARIKQLATMGRSPHEAMVVPPSVPDAERRRVQAALFSFQPTDGGRSGRVERISGFKEAQRADYEAVREALSDRPPP